MYIVHHSYKLGVQENQLYLLMAMAMVVNPARHSLLLGDGYDKIIKGKVPVLKTPHSPTFPPSTNTILW